MRDGSGPCVTALNVSLVDPELDAHAIVNASNPHVGLGSGVSGAIRDACGGVAFQREVRRRWEEDFDQPLEADDCLVTEAGTADWLRWVLHVAAVDYKHPDPETGGPTGPSRVRQCFGAALDEACLLARENDLTGELILGTALLGAGHGGLGEVVI
jgi:O-acetyl-ADP-ribose deacetylase (regulator of RNase III)